MDCQTRISCLCVANGKKLFVKDDSAAFKGHKAISEGYNKELHADHDMQTKVPSHIPQQSAQMGRDRTSTQWSNPSVAESDLTWKPKEGMTLLRKNTKRNPLFDGGDLV